MDIIAYILWGISLFELANRRGLNHTWAAWVPYANFWTLGRLSDQYNREVANKTTNHGKIVLFGNLIALAWVFICSVTVIPVSAVLGGLLGLTGVGLIFAFPIGFLAGLIAAAPQIATNVFMYISLWNVLKSCNAKCMVLLLILSIILPVCGPIFLLIFAMSKQETVEAA